MFVCLFACSPDNYHKGAREGDRKRNIFFWCMVTSVFCDSVPLHRKLDFEIRIVVDLFLHTKFCAKKNNFLRFNFKILAS